MGVIRLVRSLLFYVAFYGGTVFLVLGAISASLFGKGALLRVCEAWSHYHRICARFLLGIRIRVEGQLPQGDVLVALRHESFFEAIDLPALLQRPAIFAKIELLRIPMWGWLGAEYGLIGVEREGGARALRAMIAAARVHEREGRMLAIFPEGTRVAHGTIAPLQPGFAGLYKLLDRPVIPIALDSGVLYHRWIKRSGTVIYRVGEAIPAGLSRAEAEWRVADAINTLNRE